MSDEIDGTKIVQDLPSSLIDYVKEKLSEKIKARIKPIGKYLGQAIYNFGDSETGYVILYDEKSSDILYFVRYKRIRHNGFRLGRQVLVWRNSLHPSTGGFARHVFFKLLLPKYGALIADKEQTKNGAAFWTNSINEAFSQNLYVYVLDRRSRKTSLVQLFDTQDVIRWKDVLWGSTKSHELVFAVISQKPLALKPKS